MKVAIKALLVTAKEQGLHVEAICDGAVELIGRYSGLESDAVRAINAIRRLEYELAIRP
ncbi:hypothetical protein ACIQAL_13100 [Pseudomonas sp. NPDC088368]|uniref:hypothetical protein n=1 Tax=Pseudomonas sp. NPDC088368 TaxID=3364453 RepID=UPI0038172D35